MLMHTCVSTTMVIGTYMKKDYICEGATNETKSKYRELTEFPRTSSRTTSREGTDSEDRFPGNVFDGGRQ